MENKFVKILILFCLKFALFYETKKIIQIYAVNKSDGNLQWKSEPLSTWYINGDNFMVGNVGDIITFVSGDTLARLSTSSHQIMASKLFLHFKQMQVWHIRAGQDSLTITEIPIILINGDKR